MSIISAENLIHSYAFDSSRQRSLDDASLCIKKGEFVAVIGENGSGKSTLARHFNALIPLQSGKLTVAGLDAECRATIREIRKACGMVFQNPDNQFVSSLIEEDIAFAPRNFGISEHETQIRVKNALRAVGMSGYEKHSPHMLSGGQKQRLAIAGVLAAAPDIIIFDEVTSMLDPEGRHEVLSVIQKLHNDGHTIIMITHYIEEAVSADRAVLMKSGKIIADGSPRKIFTDISLLEEAGLIPPIPVKIYYDLAAKGIRLSQCPLTNEELAGELCSLK